MTELDNFRAQKDDFFSDHPQSPLTPEQKQVFKGLSYFDENPNFRLEVAVDKFPEQIQFEMQTSTGQTQTYTRYGSFRFDLDGQPVELTIYSSPHGFFLPFVDGLAGNETYPAGRYIDPEPLAGDRFLVDFNLAYNPYCAYNEMWSCPLTPPENRINLPIRAGEKLFET
jgi:uncharacterized protein (DUF1684 family)